ncbi:MAG: hypothetical protein M3Y24_02835 [Acidobacteriota bacterium]|nr:hypothetical protein [Acidobacteriota bacterium]
MTKIGQIHALPREEANRHHPVHVRGVVTFFNVRPSIVSTSFLDEIGSNMFVQDSSGGNWVDIAGAQGPPLESGDYVELDGITRQSDFAPDIVNPRWNKLGKAPLPVPLKAEFGRLASTREDSHWVEVEGIVRSAQMYQSNLKQISQWTVDGLPAGFPISTPPSRPILSTREFACVASAGLVSTSKIKQSQFCCSFPI